jgi:Flp pilus assembly protein RcpC/CpaB
MGAARKIPKGFKVITVPVETVKGGSSLIEPGDRVDVLACLSRGAGGRSSEDRTARTILFDIPVFAVDMQFERRRGGEESGMATKTVSLLVTSPEAEKLTLATDMGSIRLVMRSPDDSEHTDSNGASMGDIMGGDTNGAVGTNDPLLTGGQGSKFVDPNAPVVVQPTGVLTPHSAPGPTAVAQAPTPPSTWTMVLVEGSAMHDVQLPLNSNFGPIVSEHVDYQPDPPPSPPVQLPPADMSDNSNSNDNPPLEQPTAIDDGLGSETEVPNL